MAGQKGTVYVGLSGGVDSATSAALLVEQGYDVVGAFIRITVEGYPCTAGADRLDAMRVAAHLRIPFKEVDLSKQYQEKVFDASISEFARGYTPNPDTLCNREIKFGLFYEWATKEGADFVATGHYAQIADTVHGPILQKAVDAEKDQTYFLYGVPQKVLERVLFPIGHLTKREVRTLAQKHKLPNAQRRDSQGLCFLGPISVSDMLAKELNPAPGLVMSESGEVVGTHKGALVYTLGQRHGFVLPHLGPQALPHYVIAKDIQNNTITVSNHKFPMKAHETKVALRDTNWIGPVESGPVLARYRYRQALIEAEFDTHANTVVLKEPHWVPLGQSLVLYKQDRCLGGGVIKESTVY